MTLEELMRGPRDVEILAGGRWHFATVIRAYRRERGHAPGQWGWDGCAAEGGATFQLWQQTEGMSRPLEQIELTAVEIPRRVRLPYKDRLMTASEIDACQRIGRDEAARHVTIGLAEFDALCRTARANVTSAPEAAAEVVAKVAEVIGDWTSRSSPPTLEDCLGRIKGLKEHVSKLADLLNGPTGAREEVRSLDFRVKQLEKERDELLARLDEIVDRSVDACVRRDEKASKISTERDLAVEARDQAWKLVGERDREIAKILHERDILEKKLGRAKAALEGEP